MEGEGAKGPARDDTEAARLDGRVFVLGGTTGLGLMLAHEAIRLGAPCTIAGRSAVSSSRSSAWPSGAEALGIDLTDRMSVEEARLPPQDTRWFVWVAGAFLKKPHEEVSLHELDGMIDLHLRGPMWYLRRFLAAVPTPTRLIVIASSSSWRQREGEALYCAAKAAQAAFARNIVWELDQARPGSTVLLVNPGGLNVPTFWTGLDVNSTGMLSPSVVAKLIWSIAARQDRRFEEVQILRRKPVVPDSQPLITYGPMTPEVPA